MLGDHIDVTEGTFADHNIEDGAVITVILWSISEHKDDVYNLIDEIIALNGGLRGGQGQKYRDLLLNKLQIYNDELMHWDLSELNIRALPTMFGYLHSEAACC